MQVRIAERSVEGLHSILKRTLARAPAAAMSYLSMELRYGHLLHCAISEPSAFAFASERYKGIVTINGFRALVCEILGLRASQFLRTLSDRQLADLLYRDHIILMHTTAGTIAKAVATVDAAARGSRPDPVAAAGSAALSNSTQEFLVEVGGGQPARCALECSVDPSSQELGTIMNHGCHARERMIFGCRL